MGIRDWAELEKIQYLVKHTGSSFVCLLLVAPFALLTYGLGRWGMIPPQVVIAIDWIESLYVLFVLVIFAVRTIISIGKGMFDGSNRCIFA
jgi:hypothetical protein